MLSELATAITRRGYEVLTAEDGERAWELFQQSTFLVVVTDLKMPKSTGFDVLENIKKSYPATRVIIVTGLDKENAIKALRLQAFDYFQKGSSKAIPELLTAIEKAFVQAEAQIKAEKEMLSFLTHTLRNTLSGGPETVTQTLRITQNVLGEQYQETTVYKIINNLASLHSIFTSVTNMLDAYKVYVNEPGDIERKWKEDQGGSVNLNHLFSLVFKQTVGRILFEESNLRQLKRLLTLKESTIKIVRESFLNDVLWSETGFHDKIPVFEWLETYFPVLKLEIQGPNVIFNPTGIRFNLLFASISEIVYNALKYIDGEKPIRIVWKKSGEDYIFSCLNEFSETSREKSGSQKGLAFINGLTKIVDGIRLLYKDENKLFKVELHFKEPLLDIGDVG
jgi:ActR/RegA family two-component response regulator